MVQFNTFVIKRPVPRLYLTPAPQCLPPPDRVVLSRWRKNCASFRSVLCCVRYSRGSDSSVIRRALAVVLSPLCSQPAVRRGGCGVGCGAVALRRQRRCATMRAAAPVMESPHGQPRCNNHHYLAPPRPPRETRSGVLSGALRPVRRSGAASQLLHPRAHVRDARSMAVWRQQYRRARESD